MVRRPQPRRGVVILIVLSLLVLFVLLVVTFAIVAGQYRRAAQAVGRREWLGEDPQKTADRVMYALVREPDLNQTGSPFRGHALADGRLWPLLQGQRVRQCHLTGGRPDREFNFTFPFRVDRAHPAISCRGYLQRQRVDFHQHVRDQPALQGVSTRVVAYAYTPANARPIPPTARCAS